MGSISSPSTNVLHINILIHLQIDLSFIRIFYGRKVYDTMETEAYIVTYKELFRLLLLILFS